MSLLLLLLLLLVAKQVDGSEVVGERIACLKNIKYMHELYTFCFLFLFWNRSVFRSRRTSINMHVGFFFLLHYQESFFVVSHKAQGIRILLTYPNHE